MIRTATKRKDGPSETSQIRQARRLRSKVPQSPPKRNPRWLFPWAIEREYNKYLLSIVNFIGAETRRTFNDDRLSRLKNEASSLRVDDYVEDIEGLFRAIRISIPAEGFSDEAIKSRLRAFSKMTEEFNRAQWSKILKSALGVDLILTEPWLQAELNRFVNDNIELIQSMRDDQLRNTQRVILNGVRDGTRNREIAQMIRERTDVMRSRANLIARDQISKFNGRVTELRQKQVGVERYVWQSSDDERVRPTHAENDGKTFSWKNPPSNTGHPSEDIQCRCWADPIFDDVYEKLGNEKPIDEPAKANKPKRRRVVKKSAVVQAEDEIRNLKKEQLIGFDNAGNKLLHEYGNANSVDISPQSIEIMLRQRVTLTHNHPKSSSFSPADMNIALTAHVNEMRVTSRLADYRLAVKTTNGATVEFDRRKIIAGTDSLTPAAQRIYDEELRKHEIRFERAVIENPSVDHAVFWREVYHNVWERVFNKNELDLKGDYEYKRIKRKEGK